MNQQYRSQIEVTALRNSGGGYEVTFADGSVEHVADRLFELMFVPMIRAEDLDTCEPYWYAATKEQIEFDSRWRAEWQQLGLPMPEDLPYVGSGGTIIYDWDTYREATLSIGVGKDSIWYVIHLRDTETEYKLIEKNAVFYYDRIGPSGLPSGLTELFRRWAEAIGHPLELKE